MGGRRVCLLFCSIRLEREEMYNYAEGYDMRFCREDTLNKHETMLCDTLGSQIVFTTLRGIRAKGKNELDLIQAHNVAA
jgi:hypothetical protein